MRMLQQEANSIMSTIPADFPPPSAVTSDSYTNPSFSHIMQDLPNKCSIVRSDLDCLITYTAGCMNQINTPAPYLPHGTHIHGFSGSMTPGPNEIYRAKQFLDKYCDYNGGWRTTQCFGKPDLRNCEASLTTISSGVQPCHNFNTFRSCAINYVRNNCVPHEKIHISSYLIDKASDQAWQCSPGEYYLSAFGNIDRSTHFGLPGQTHFPGDRHDGPVDRQFPVVPYTGPGSMSGSYGQTGMMGHIPPPVIAGQPPYHGQPPLSGSLGIGGSPSSMGLPPGQFGPGSVSYGGSTSLGDAHSQYPHSHTITGEPVPPGGIQPPLPGQPPYFLGGSFSPAAQGYGDRQFQLFPAENCVEKSVYFARSCEDMLLQRQREARNARTGIDVQRRLCCSLFFYHDCLSKTVIQYCRDASPTTVDIMMGQRKREMVITCRDFSREQCNSSYELQPSSMSIVIILVIATLRAFSM